MASENAYPILPRETSVRVKLLKTIEHEDRTFKPGAIGLCLNTQQHRRKKKQPVWFAKVKYPVYLDLEDLKAI